MALLTVVTFAGAVLFTGIAYLIHTAYQHRRHVNELRKQGVPMPKGWSWIFGHLLVLQKYMNKYPSDSAVTYATQEIAAEFADTEVFLLDIWPVYPALFMIFGPEPAYQVCNKNNHPKAHITSGFLRPVSGGPNLIGMNGPEWKRWRSLFNPGFSTGAMLNNVPHVVDSVLTFKEKLVEQMGKGLFSLDELAMKLTQEIILKVTLDDDSNYQREPNVLASSLSKIVHWHSFWDPRILLNPLRPFVQKYYGYLMNKYISKELVKRYEETKAEHENGVNGKAKSTKSVISLTLEAYLAEQKNSDAPPSAKLEESFAKMAVCQLRIFLFAGSDTTAATLVYVYHMLNKHPKWQQKLMEEHDEVFGKNPADAVQLLKENPSLLNNCKQTFAVIKETLRLFAPAGTLRAGGAERIVTDLQGNNYTMKGAGATVIHQAIHRNPRVWPRPDDFLPERWLVGPEHELYPDQAAFRPMEQGPRNCVGQTLVWNEIRVALVLTCRDIKISDAYKEYDAKVEREMGALTKLKRRIFGSPMKSAKGERAYQTETGAMHPSDGYPCTVSWVREH